MQTTVLLTPPLQVKDMMTTNLIFAETLIALSRSYIKRCQKIFEKFVTINSSFTLLKSQLMTVVNYFSKNDVKVTFI